MRKKLKHLLQYFDGINGVLFTLYFAFVLLTFAIVNVHFSFYYFIIFFIFAVLISLAICPYVLKKLSLCSVSLTENHINKRFVLGVIFFLVPFMTFSIYYLAHFPLGFYNDAIAQYRQAITNNYSDWHPVIHTLLFFKLPLTVSGGWIGSIALFQITLASAALSYTFSVIYKHTNIKYTLVSVLFVVLNPQIGYNFVQPWKDNAFAIGALLLSSYGLQIYFSRGEWLKKRINTATFVLTMAITTLFRHNAVLFTIPLLLAVLLIVSQKRAAIICLCVLLITVGVKGPLYSCLDVQEPDGRQLETLGLPMTIIGAVVTFDSDAADEETKEFAYKIAPKEVWEENYTYGSYNQVKFIDTVNNYVIEEYGAEKVLRMMISCIKNSPVVSLTALIKLTEGFYTISDKYCSVIKPAVRENDFNIVQSGNASLQEICRAYTNVCLDLFPNFYMFLGIVNLILIASVLAKFKFNKCDDLKKLLFVIPAFSYNIATTLLLTGVEDSIRFFYYTVLIAPVLIVYIYRKDVERSDANPVVCE